MNGRFFGGDALAAHCDYLNVTIPFDQSGGVQDEVLVACGRAGIGGRVLDPGVFDCGGGTLWMRRRGLVLVVGVSGAALEMLRKVGAFNDLLWVLADRPHRVTRLDAAHDVPMEAGPELRRLFDLGNGEGIRLGQRRASVSLSGWKIGVAGHETGTLYVGTMQSEIRAKVYDKRQERIDRSFPDPGPLLRFEVTVTGKCGASLRDAENPTGLFWHFAAPDLLCPPPGVILPAWVPGGVGFDLPGRFLLSPWDRLQHYLSDGEVMRVAVRLADACGPSGREWLCKVIAELPETASGG